MHMGAGFNACVLTHDHAGEQPFTRSLDGVTVPDDVALACVKLAAAWYAHARTGADGLRRETLGDYSADYSCSALPADVEGALRPYLEPRLG